MSSGPQKRPTDELLLDFHLDRLEHETRSWIEAELARDREVRRRSERLGRILQPLDHWGTGAAPVNLADRVMNHVHRASQPQSGGPRIIRGPWGRMREMIAVAACLVLLVGVAVPGMASVRDRAQRAMCATNLATIFQGASSYQQASNDSLPYAGALVRASWLPGADSAAPYVSNSRHPYLLLKLKYGPKPADFLCPARCDSRPPADDVASRDDFADAGRISYDSLNLAGTSPNVRPPRALAYMSDANPLFVNARFNEAVDPSKTNSPAHRGRGQTVLKLDGNVQFVRTPVYAADDNLWTIRNVRSYRGTEAPTNPDDAFLVPGFPADQK